VMRVRIHMWSASRPSGRARGHHIWCGYGLRMESARDGQVMRIPEPGCRSVNGDYCQMPGLSIVSLVSGGSIAEPYSSITYRQILFPEERPLLLHGSPCQRTIFRLPARGRADHRYATSSCSGALRRGRRRRPETGLRHHRRRGRRKAAAKLVRRPRRPHRAHQDLGPEVRARPVVRRAVPRCAVAWNLLTGNTLPSILGRRCVQ
jgi:hypothetical protein